MTTSGSTTNQLTRNEIITAALRKLGVIAEGQTPSAQNYTDGALALNALIAEFRVLGMPLWARQSYTITPVAGTSSYNIGVGQTINSPYPLKIYQAYRTDSTSTTKIQMDIIADYNFNMLPTNSSGLPIQVSYTPRVNCGVLKMWPTPDSTAASGSTVTIVYQRPTEYVDTSSNTLDVPEEWLNAIIYNLASRLAPEWGTPLPDREALEMTAEKLLSRVLDYGSEDGSLYFQVDRQGRY